MKTRCKVFVDGEQIGTDKMLLCTVANGQYVGGAFRCAPRSESDDGLAEICHVRPVSRFTFVRLIKAYTNGTHLDDPRFDKIINYKKGKKIDVEAPEGFMISIDGELVEANRFSVEVINRAINFVVPQSF
jgi:diacylglycerol kinase (ATP)